MVVQPAVTGMLGTSFCRRIKVLRCVIPAECLASTETQFAMTLERVERDNSRIVFDKPKCIFDIIITKEDRFIRIRDAKIPEPNEETEKGAREMTLPFRNFVDPIIESFAPNKRSEGGIKNWPRVFPDIIHIHHRLGGKVEVADKPKKTVINKNHVTTLAIFDHNFLEFICMQGT
jgi:hypothetical protein